MVENENKCINARDKIEYNINMQYDKHKITKKVYYDLRDSLSYLYSELDLLQEKVGEN